MESRDIIKVLKQVDENTTTYNKIFINGAWGIGKSYFVSKYINENKDNFVYVSLFGKINFESIENSIAKELFKKLNGIKKKKKQLHDLVRTLKGSVSFNGFSINSPEMARKGLISEYATLFESKSLIIVFDDLERKSGNILIEDIMGMIEEFSQYNKVKLVIIGDEENMIQDDQDKWQRFKEKIIEKEYKIDSFSDDAIDNLVRQEIFNYVNHNEIENFVNDFIKCHKLKNLRTITKGINLFKEIVNNYVKYNENNEYERVNLMLLKNCMAVAIECTENFYEPKNTEKENTYQNIIDGNIESRIISHYFNSIYTNNKDVYVLPCILKIFECDINKDTINKLNLIIDNYLAIKTEEKDIFYLSESDIEKRVNEKYLNMKNNSYNFISLEKYMDDFHDIINWNEVINLGYANDELSNIFYKILLDNYYDANKNIYNNTIDKFYLRRMESKKLDELINNYNSLIKDKYLDDKFCLMENNFKSEIFNEGILEWLDFILMQDNNIIIIEKFIDLCRSNNFFIPDLSAEITDDVWGWTHKIWKIFYERMSEKYKEELNAYAETLKTNKLSTYRISKLQEYRPLVDKNEK